MKIRFVPQPLANQLNMGDYIQAATDPSNAYEEIRMAVAWGKRSGLGRIAPRLRSFLALPNRSVQAIVGVSEGGASSQGLELLLDLTDKAYVFHDAGRTFHPKVFLATGPTSASLFVGSNNMTAGGLAWNYEAALWADLDLAEAEDQQLHQSVLDFFADLLNDTNVCVPLDAGSMAGILASPALRIQDEDAARRKSSSRFVQPEDDDGVGLGLVSTIFGQSATSKRPLSKLPSPPAASQSGGAAASASPTAPVPPTATASAATAPASPQTPPNGVPAAVATRRWFKTMDRTAAQQVPSPRTNPTGNLRLSQEGFPIDHKNYFERTFFGGLPWAPRPSDPTVAEVSVAFDVYINGQSFGVHNLVLSHALHRISGQGNVPTLLHWGPLSPVLRATSYVNEVVTLERLVGGTYRLTIEPHATGPFLP